MTTEIRVGGGEVKAPPTPPSFHDAEYDLEVYPAACINPVLDIMVPTHGNLQLTINCLNSLYRFTQTPFHLIISGDNAPGDYGLTPQYIKELQKKHNNITYCHLNRPSWKTGNTFFNATLKYAKTEFFVTVMNSVTVEPQWEMVGLSLMKKDPQIGTIGFKCLFPNGLIESAGIAFMGHLPTDIGRDEPGYRMNEVREAEAVQWAFALHRTKALIGTLEADLFQGHVGWDDIDNNMCVRKKGWKILYCGQGAGIHQPRSTRGSNSVDASRKNQENAHIFFKRWGLWNKYMEANKMNVADILKGETKDVLSQGVTRIQVLQSLLKQAEAEIRPLVDAALKEIGVEPGKYLLEMNPQKNTWLIKLNSDTPSVETQLVKPASDTEMAPEELKTTEEVKV